MRPLNRKKWPGPTPRRARSSETRTTGRSAANESERPVTTPPPPLQRRLPCSRRATPGSQTAASDGSVLNSPRIHPPPTRAARAWHPIAPNAGSSMARRRATQTAPGRTAGDQRHSARPVGWGRSLPASRVRARQCRPQLGAVTPEETLGDGGTCARTSRGACTRKQAKCEATERASASVHEKVRNQTAPVQSARPDLSSNLAASQARSSCISPSGSLTQALRHLL